MTVIWKQCDSLDGYEVSNTGLLRSVDRFVPRSDTGTLVLYRGTTIKPQIDGCGYARVRLSVGGRSISRRVHRLVATAFLENTRSYPEVNHIDGIKTNNNVDNLEWCSASHNQKHAIDNGLKVIKFGDGSPRYTGSVTAINASGEIVAVMRGNEDMRRNGFDYRLVSAVILGKRRTHNGCTFSKEHI